MLVRRFQIKVGRAAQFGMAIHHRDMTGPGIDPHIEGVGAPFCPGRKAEFLRPPGVVFFKPEIGPA
jgi:hypothetical protein